MGILTAAELEKEIKSAITRKIYYIYGKDSGRVHSLAGAVRKKYLGTGYSQSDINRFEGREFNVSDFADTAEIYPLFTEYNFIEINDLNAEELTAEQMKSFIKVLENLPEQTIILISITGYDVKGGKKTPGAKNKKVIDTAAKFGSVAEAELRKPADMYKDIMQLASECGSSISRHDAEKLAQICLGDTQRTENEIHKLASFANGEAITEQMIDDMVSVGIDTNAFALASAVTSFNAPLAMKILDDLVSQRTEGVVILSAVSSAFMDIYRAAAAINSSVNETDVAIDFGYRGREFVVRNSFRDARKTSIEHLRKFMRILERADLELKSTRLDQKIIIEKAIVQMLAVRNGV